MWITGFGLVVGFLCVTREGAYDEGPGRKRIGPSRKRMGPGRKRMGPGRKRLFRVSCIQNPISMEARVSDQFEQVGS